MNSKLYSDVTVLNQFSKKAFLHRSFTFCFKSQIMTVVLKYGTRGNCGFNFQANFTFTNALFQPQISINVLYWRKFHENIKEDN